MKDASDPACGRPELDFRENARLILPAVLEEFYTCDPQGNDGLEILHELRIAAKRLRYSLEFFESCYGKRLAGRLDLIRDLQELLGGIHDCDVMMEFLSVRRDKLKDREGAEQILVGLEELIEDFRNRRAQLTGKFFVLWNRRFGSRFKTGLLNIINKPNVRLSAKSKAQE